MRATNRFRRDNQEHVDANIKAQFASQAAIRWLGLRLQFIGVAVVTSVSFIAVIQHQYDVADPGKCLLKYKHKGILFSSLKRQLTWSFVLDITLVS